jgi:small subunit ribosomal protein S1
METTISAPTSEIELKQKFTGKVVRTSLAGIIVDIGQSLPGVIHISQLQKDPINRVEDVVTVGQEVTTWVRRVKKDRIELTMIEPLGLEWREMQPDMIVKGKVVRLETYGAFVDIGGERPGLVHVSEIAHGYIKNPSELLKEGDEVEAKILEINRRKKQIRLSMKAVLPKPEEVVEAKPKRKGRKEKFAEMAEVNDEPKEPELTAMEIAWREALDKAKDQNRSVNIKSKRAKGKVREQEDILERTLEQRMPTGN